MRIVKLTFLAITAFVAVTLTGCEKEGCTDVNANNYNDEAKKDDGTCTYPIINTLSSNSSGDISGAGGTASKAWTFTANQSVVDWDMSISASTGSFQLVLKDAAGVTVLNKILTAGSGPQSASGITATGTPGTWTVTVTLTNFTGTGDYSFL